MDYYYNNNGNAYGYNYGAPRPQAANTQPLTQEEIAKLRHSADDLNMQISPEDALRAICTHKDKNGVSTLSVDETKNDGSVVCSICGRSFHIKDITDKEVEDIVETVIDILETCKTTYLDAPANFIREYYMVIPLLRKLAELYKRSINNFAKYDGSPQDLNRYNSNFSGFDALNQIITGGPAYNPYGMYQQPYMGQQQPFMGQPVQQQPMQQPVAQQYAAPQFNGFATPAPMMGGFNNPMAYGSPAPMQNQVPVQQPMQQPVVQAPSAGVVPPAQPMPDAAAQSSATEVQQQQVFNV